MTFDLSKTPTVSQDGNLYPLETDTRFWLPGERGIVYGGLMGPDPGAKPHEYVISAGLRDALLALWNRAERTMALIHSEGEFNNDEAEEYGFHELDGILMALESKA